MNVLYRKLKLIVSNTSHTDDSTTLMGKNNNDSNLINALNQTIFQIDKAHQWVYLNAEWERLTGFTVKETLGNNMLQYVHPDDKKKCAVFIQSIYENIASSSSLKIRFLSKNDRLCWVNMQANTFIDPISNKPHLIGVISDITEHVREYGLHQATHRTLYTLINNLCGLVYRGRNDRDWTMEFVSEGCYELTGYSPSELINQTVTFGSLINPNDQDLVWTNVQTALRENNFYELNYRIQTNNGIEKWVWERGKGNFSSNGELLSIEGFIVDITDYKRNKQKENEEILYKTKTKLPQKHLFLDRLNTAIARTFVVPNYKFALLITYIDRFKKLQGRFPADIIDQVVINISRKINRIINPTASFCLFGDGEFGLLLEHTDSIESVRTLIQSIHNALLEPITIESIDTFVTVSIGVYLSTNTIDDRNAVINKTYTALGRAKSLGGSRYEIFDETINARMYALDRMEQEIHYAIGNDELHICYQPILDKRKNTNTTFEAQLFWDHPRRGKIASSVFSPIKEDKEVVSLLNEWILDTVIEHTKTWALQPDFSKKINININFFGEQIFNNGFLSSLEQKLSNIIYNKIKFSINIPEQSVYTLLQRQIDTINKLHDEKDIGLIIETNKPMLPASKDLFALSIDAVKMNSLLKTEHHQERQRAKAQIDYMHALGKTLIINGVNNAEELNAMHALGFDYIQGDWISTPLKSEVMIQRVKCPGQSYT